jgi:hypothetical protein
MILFIVCVSRGNNRVVLRIHICKKKFQLVFFTYFD